MINLFLILFLAAFVFLAYRKIVLGLALIIVFLPTYLWRLNIWVFPTTLLELMIVAIFIIWLIKDKKYKKINFSFRHQAKNIFPKALQYLLAAWLLVSVLALLTNFSFAALGLWRAYFLEPMMFFLVFVYSIRDKKDWRLIIDALACLLICLFILAIYQNFSHWNFISAYNFPHAKRLTGPYAYPNALSLLVAPLSSFFMGLWLYSKDKLRDIYYLLFFVFGFSLAIMTLSQGAMLAIAISLFLALMLAKKIRKYGIAILIILAVGFFIFLPSINFDPNLNLNSSSLDIRFNQWQETADLLSDNFIFGSGLAGYQKALKIYHQTDWLEIYLYPHNIFLNFWTELGIFGLAVFVGIMIYIFFLLKKLFSKQNALAWPLTLMWLTWFIHGLVDVPYFKNDLAVFFFIMLGITFLASLEKQNVKI